MVGNKNKHIWKYLALSLFGGAVFLVGVVFFTPPVQAITISQINLEIVARPGDTIEQLVQLYDESLTGATVYPVVYNFTEDPVAEGAALIFTDPEDLRPDRNWVKWSPAQVLGEDAVIEEIDTDATDEEEVVADDAETEQVVPGDLGQEEIPLKLPLEGRELFDFPYWIGIPSDAEPGTHLISLVFQLKPTEDTGEEGTSIYIGTNVATNIFLKVLGATIDDIEVEFKSGVFGKKGTDVTVAERKESFQQKSFFLKPPVDFLVTIDNKGNTHQKPDGNIKIVNDLFGSRIEEIQVNEVNKIILPGTDRTFEVSSYGQGFMFGKYRAKITLLYGDPLKPVQKEIAFWIVPLVEILIVLGAILLLIIIIIVIRKFRKKKREKKEKEKEEKMRQRIIEELKGKKGKSSDRGPLKEEKQPKKKGKNKKK